MSSMSEKGNADRGVSENCLTIENFSITLGDFKAENLNLKVNAGEYCIIIGPTGAGKTILLETIAGIHRLKTGRIYLHGRDITDMPPELRGIGIVYQDYMLFPHMTIGDNIAFGLKQRGVSMEERVRKTAEIANKLGIGHLLGRYPQTLSGGEKQRAAIARAVILRPKVLLLDEPLSALDNTTRESLRRELKKLHNEMHTTIIHITHHFEDIYSLADRVVVMREGSAGVTRVNNAASGIVMKNRKPNIRMPAITAVSVLPAPVFCIEQVFIFNSDRDRKNADP